jgi:polysaccharide export outer membrane protein
MLLLALTGLMGCAHNGKYVWAADLPLKDEKVEPIVSPGDTLTVEVQRQPTLSGEFLVREDGHYTQPVAGSIEAANKTPRQIAAAVTAALRGVVIDPVVSVWISKTTPIRISIVGEVRAPGSFELARDRTLLSALARAGWVTEFAHVDRIFVVRVGSSERIRFRLQDITTAEPWAAQFQLSDSDAVVVE